MKSFPALLLTALVAIPATAQSFVTTTPRDEAAIRAIVHRDAVDANDPQVAADLDWENAFGIRYYDLKKRDAFYSAIVKPQMANLTTDDTLEVKVKFVTPDVAIADAYWHIAGQVYGGQTKPGPDRWGRTTYVCKKEPTGWTAVLERVADLRAPYYKHFDAIPAAFPVPAATLASYAGNYAYAPGKFVTVAVSGDHLLFTKNGKTYPVIPTSATEFLLFFPEDLAEYNKITFVTTADGHMAYTFAYENGEEPTPPIVKAP